MHALLTAYYSKGYHCYLRVCHHRVEAEAVRARQQLPRRVGASQVERQDDGSGAVARGPGELERVDEGGARDDRRWPREVTAGALLLTRCVGDRRGGEACLDPWVNICI